MQGLNNNNNGIIIILIIIIIIIVIIIIKTVVSRHMQFLHLVHTKQCYLKKIIIGLISIWPTIKSVTSCSVDCAKR